jgi:sugar/nucleoside kinase (ribokinase family)
MRRDFIVLPSGEIQLDVPGGNVLYAAAGLAIWEPDPPPGLVARVGVDYPAEWLNTFTRKGFDRRGVRVLNHSMDLRSFIAYSEQSTRIEEDPAAFFTRRGLPFPKTLLNYQSRSSSPDSRTRLSPNSIRQGDLPAAFMEATAAHICPLDYLTHSLLPAVLRQDGFTFVTLDPATGYMNPSFREDVPSLITGLNAFLPAEEELRMLLLGRSDDLWEMADIIAMYGCEWVVIKRGERGQLLYDATTRTRWEIPAYPTKLVDPTGAGDAFCGGFQAGYQRTFDPLMAVLHGNISASMVIEGFGPFYALDALPGLAQARLDSLRHSVRKI